MGLKLSDLDPDDVEYLPQGASAGSSKLKLSNLSPGDYEFVQTPKPSVAESAARGLAQGGSFGLEPTLAGLGGVVGDRLGRSGIAQVQSTHPDVQAKLDKIQADNTPSANDVFKKTYGEENTANEQAKQANPLAYYGGELAPLAMKVGPALYNAAKDIPIGSAVKTAIAMKLGIPHAFANVASKIGDKLSDQVAAKIAARMGATGAAEAAEAAAPVAEAAAPIAEEAVQGVKAVYDPFLKKFLNQ